MNFQTLSLASHAGILRLTINRPDKLNALNLLMMQELNDAIQLAEEDPNTRGVIITGAGTKAFVAGADISEISQLNELNARKFAERGQEIFARIEDLSKPVIAAVNGFALGGGCELAMACHLRVASENARFGQPEINLGIIPGYGGTQRLPRYIGKSRALEMLLTGDMISAQMALQWGLVNYVVTQGELLEKCESILAKVIQQPPVATAHLINTVNAVYRIENGFQVEANAFANCCGTEDFVEGTSAFLEKRKPNFKGN
ncbi:MAG: enoyl-CoA hydratase/isomerase family protein [Bernardetiaceae bacterium]